MIWTSLIAQGKRRLWMSLFVAIFIALVYLHFARFYQGSVSGWILGLGWTVVLANLLRAAGTLAYHLDRHPFRTWDLGLESDQAPPGKSFELELRTAMRRPAKVKRVTAALRCNRRRALDTGRRELSVLHDEEQVLDRDFSAEAGAEKMYRVSLRVPPDAPYSYRSMDGKIAWVIAVVADVEGWGELRDEIEVMVAPG